MGCMVGTFGRYDVYIGIMLKKVTGSCSTSYIGLRRFGVATLQAITSTASANGNLSKLQLARFVFLNSGLFIGQALGTSHVDMDLGFELNHD